MANSKIKNYMPKTSWNSAHGGVAFGEDSDGMRVDGSTSEDIFIIDLMGPNGTVRLTLSASSGKLSKITSGGNWETIKTIY